MRIILNLAGFLLLLAATPVCYGQTNKETAQAKTSQAIKLEDEEGKYDEAIKLLQEACKLDPDNITYPYELGYAYTAKKDYKTASDILEKLLSHKDVYGRIFQLLGNVYDYQGMPDKAIATYEKGLKKFPGAGQLYLELGNMYVATKEYGKAIVYYENGIKADPQFPSNYYWATRLYCGSKEKVWGMLYGEIFINLERNSKRTREISKLLFDTYKSQIKFSSKGDSTSVDFSAAVIDASEIKDPKNFKIPFSWGVYARILSMSVISEKQIDLRSLNNIRTRFIELYFQDDNSKKYLNVLFDYEQSMIKAGHFETYNYWLLSEGDKDAFQQWQTANKDKWTAFAKWFTDNKLQLDETHRFYRQQY